MPAPPRPTLVDVLQIVDIRTKIVSLSSLAIGTAYAAAAWQAFSPGVFTLMLLATLFVDMGTTAFNSYYDFRDGVDTADTDVERWKALVQRGVDPAFALKLAWGLFGLAGLTGLAIGALVDWRIVPVGAASMLIGLLYSGGPRPISGLPVGEAFAGGLLGLVLIAVAAYVQHPTPDPRVLWLGVPSSVLIATILSVNNACDIVGDGKAGRRTLAIVLGHDGAARMIRAQAALTLVAAVALVPLGVLPVSALAPLALAALFGARTLAAMQRRGYSHPAKAAAMGGISVVFLVYTLALLVAIAFKAAGLP